MKKINVGILNFTDSSSAGGGYHYIMSVIDALIDIPDFNLIVFYTDKKFREKFNLNGKCELVYIDREVTIYRKLIRFLILLLNIRSNNLGCYEVIRNKNLDIILNFGSLIAFQFGLPVVTFIGDIMYRFFRGLHEYSRFESFTRDFTNKRFVRYSEYIVVDSVRSAEDMKSVFGINSDRCVSIAMCAPPQVYKYKDILEDEVDETVSNLGITRDFIFYPAQFWAHKNHIGLIKAIKRINEIYGIEVTVVFVGSHNWKFLSEIQKFIKRNSVESQFIFPGYVSEKELVALYKKTVALVYPSLAEYTNLPVLEAMVLGTPILCSNVFAMPEQVGNAALLFNPYDIGDMAEKIYKVWVDKSTRDSLVLNGYKRNLFSTKEVFFDSWKTLIEKSIN